MLGDLILLFKQIQQQKNAKIAYLLKLIKWNYTEGLIDKGTPPFHFPFLLLLPPALLSGPSFPLISFPAVLSSPTHALLRYSNVTQIWNLTNLTIKHADLFLGQIIDLLGAEVIKPEESLLLCQMIITYLQDVLSIPLARKVCRIVSIVRFLSHNTRCIKSFVRVHSLMHRSSLLFGLCYLTCYATFADSN